MFGPSPTFPGGPGGFPAGVGGGSSGFSGRDIVWVDLRFPAGGSGNESTPFNTANIGLAAVPDGGTLVMVGGDASTEAGVAIGARSFAARGFGGQHAGGGLTPKLPTLTYAITTGTQRLAFANISVALVHSGSSASLTQFYFAFCPVVSLTAGTDAPPIFWVGDATCTFSGAGGAATFIGGTIDGYVANSGAITARGVNVTNALESSVSIALLDGCTFGAVSITAPAITIDPTSYKLAVLAGVSFSTTPTVLFTSGAPSDIGTANAEGTSNDLARRNHVHNLPFTPVQTALAAATSSISVNSQKITNLAAPTSGSDAVTKTYADALASGLKVKTPAVAVATANQATMTGQAQTVDGVALDTVGMRVLLTAQTTATQNGLWVIAAGAWTRPTDFAVGSSAAQSYVLITGGTTGAGSSYFCTTTVGSDVVDTNNLTWVLFSQSASVTAGAGLTKTGNTLDVIAGDATLVVSADSLVVGIIGNANLANNTIALARLANAGAQNDFLMRKSASGGAWEDGTAAEARTALGVFAYGALFPVRAATTANITLSGTQTVDGVALIATDRCLVKDQSTGANNGVYLVAAGAWTRATDADGAGELVGGMLFPISEGTVNGNRVAMLTTNDPITIGSTALVFALDRTVALGAVAPLDVTKAAAAIGTSTLAAPIDHKHDISTGVVIDIGTAANAEGTATSLARSDHAHRITFTVVAAVLAAASAAISVNSQKITNLATPTVATDAATKGYVDAWPGIPGGSTTQLQYNNAGAFDGASGITVVGSETALSFTTTTVATGDLRHAHGANVSFGRNQAASQDVPLTRWGNFANDLLYFGSSSSDAGKVANMRWGIHTGGAFQWEVNGSAVGTIDATSLALGARNLTQTSGIIQQGTTPAASGFWRIPNSTGPALAARGAGAYDVKIVDGVDGTDIIRFGDSARALSVYFDVKTGGNYQWWVNSASVAQLDATALALGARNLTLSSGVIKQGTTPATTGLWQLPGLGANVYAAARTNAGSANINLLAKDGSDNVFLGDSAAGGNLVLDAASTKIVEIRVAAGTEYQFSATALTMNGNNLLMGAGFASFGTNPAGGGWLRVPTATGGVLTARNYDNSGDASVAYVSGNSSTFSDLTIGDGAAKGHATLYLSAIGQAIVQLATFNEYVFGTSALDVTNNYIAIGGSNYPTAGSALRLSNGVTAVVRNGANTQNIQVFNFGSSDELSIWDQSQGGNVNYDVATTKIHKFRVAGGSEYELSATALDMKGNNLLMGAGFVSSGTTPATAGTIRLHNAFSSVSMRNAANSGNLTLLAASSDDIYAGDLAATKLYLQSGADVTIAPGAAGGLYIFNDGNVDFRDNDLKIGGFSPAAGGTIRLNNTNTVYFRNAANSGDVLALNVTASDHVAIGESTNCEGIDFTVKTAGSHTFKVSGSSRLVISNTAVLVTGAPLNFSTAGINGPTYVEHLQLGTPSNPGSTGWRTYTDGSGNLVTRNSAGTVRTLASP